MNAKMRFGLVMSALSLVGAVGGGCDQGGGNGNGGVQDQRVPRGFSLVLPLFAANSAWNQKADSAAVLASSDQQILTLYRVLRGDTTSLRPVGPAPTTWPFMDVSFNDYAFPIFQAGSGQQSVGLCDYEGQSSWPNPKFGGTQQAGGPVTIPTSVGLVRPAGPRNRGADGHVVLYDPSTFVAYDLWQATTVQNGPCQSVGGGRVGSVIYAAGAADFFDVRGAGVNPDGVSSARAAGTPLLAGMILPEDVERGQIAHALSCAIPGLRNTSSNASNPLSSDYFYPASATETDYYSVDANALGAGQRLRLKQTLVNAQGQALDETQLSPITQMFLEALRTYGAYPLDGAAGFSFSAEDIHTGELNRTADQVNALIGQPGGTALSTGKTKWQIVIEQLNIELEQIPLAYGPWQDGQTPRTATITTANFEVVAPATRP